MFKATKDFITERQKFCKMKLSVVLVEKKGGGRPNDCSNNALDASEAGTEVRTITGWLVHPYNKINNSTEIIQHWWNMNVDGTYFDTTPNISSDCEYVKDMDLIHYFFKNYDTVDSNTALSLLYSDGKFIGVDTDEHSPSGIKHLIIFSLDTPVLYRAKS